MEPLLVAAIQLTSSADVPDNLLRASRLCERAQARGAQIILLPENFALMSSDETEKFRHAVDLGAGANNATRPSNFIIDKMRALAARLKVHLILGGLPERAAASGTSATPRVHNACVQICPDGSLGAIYRKIHLFDVDFAAAATRLHESDTVAPGALDQAVIAETPWAGVGLSVCYDLRFPEFYRRLVDKGAHILVVPAAFTLHTGKDHWHVLLRARAIENQCFVIAAAQQGRHAGGRQTYGHSLIADPWGTVLAECPDGEGFIVAELDFAAQNRVRSELPCLTHRRIGIVGGHDGI